MRRLFHPFKLILILLKRVLVKQIEVVVVVDLNKLILVESKMIIKWTFRHITIVLV
jgi:hypothetical protein